MIRKKSIQEMYMKYMRNVHEMYVKSMWNVREMYVNCTWNEMYIDLYMMQLLQALLLLKA